MKSANYLLGKKLENQLLEYLNDIQPFLYYDTFNQIELPITPYYPSLYRYSSFDIYNKYITLELKSRTDALINLQNNLLDTSKIINNHSIFLYTYENRLELLNNLHFISYNKNIFDTFTIQSTKNNCNLFIIPKTEYSFTKLNMKNTHSHTININYTDDYKDAHDTIIATDITKYKSTFGIYNL